MKLVSLYSTVKQNFMKRNKKHVSASQVNTFVFSLLTY